MKGRRRYFFVSCTEPSGIHRALYTGWFWPGIWGLNAQHMVADSDVPQECGVSPLVWAAFAPIRFYESRRVCAILSHDPILNE